jgi:hypothetical protein
MTKILSAMAVSVDGFITGRDPGAGHGLGDGGVLHDWYWDGDTLRDWSTRSSSTRCRYCWAPVAGSSRNCRPTCGSASSRPCRHPG